MPIGYDGCLTRTGSIRLLDSECLNSKLSKYPAYKSAPDVIASIRFKTRSDISVRPVQLVPPHRSMHSVDSRSSVSSSCATHMEPIMQDIDWQDVVDEDVDGMYQLTADMVNESLAFLYPNLPSTAIEPIRALMLDRENGFGSFRFDVLALSPLLPSTSSLVFLSHVVFNVLAFDGLDMDVLVAWVRAVDSKYDPKIPYHNADHAADVLHTLFCILVHSHLRSTLSEPMQIASLLAAITHDVAHFGRTNAFLTKSKHAVSIAYPLCCPLEAMHAAIGLDMLNEHNVLAHLPPATQDELRHVIHKAIFTTSLCEQKNLLAALHSVHETSPDYSLVLVQAAVHVADLGQTTKPFAVHRQWVNRLHEELCCQGDTEKSLGWTVPPMGDRSCGLSTASQLYFLENLVLPVLSVVDDALDGGLDPLVAQLCANIDEWKACK
ncbi:hypothetical protein LEN26_013906 [Aphanomyces euteiches]|nr:hypothetical protein LEN26_013906 [Aphanomyces euteiches]KAH9126389.1 hypothetical protein AeMF1_003179 [Aphanomyces euteiches]KAH9186320.1 hypothetical protein AeNC1_011707 [Aphanomyces euteiches]